MTTRNARKCTEMHAAARSATRHTRVANAYAARSWARYRSQTRYRPLSSEFISPPPPLAGDGRGGGGCADAPGFCHAATLAEVEKNGYVLTPGRYVGAPEEVGDDEAFEDKMQRLTAQLGEQMTTGAELDAVIDARLGELGYAV